jgi:hypothetical protein
MCVRLTRKYADLIDGVDLSSAHVGDRIDLSRHDAAVLIAEGWAEAAARGRRQPAARAIAAETPRRRRRPAQKKAR